MKPLVLPLLCAAFWLGACQSDPKVRAKPTLEETRRVLSEDNSPPPHAGTIPAAARPKGSGDGGDLLAKVAGQELRAQDVLAAWAFRDSESLRDLFDRLVLDRLVQAEATRLGVQLLPELLEADWRETLAYFDERVAEAQPGMARGAFIQTRLGLDPEAYLTSMRERRRIDLTAARCVRAYSLENDAVLARLIVAPDRQVADRVEAGLAQGKSFEDLAREFSVDPSAELGGRIAPVIRSRAAMSRLAFATAVGEVGGPIQEGQRFLFLYAEALRPGVGGRWKDLAEPVEASLAEQPIEDLEFLQWQAMALARYEVDTSGMNRILGAETP
ncbi:MAG: peptidylprolyl isomerase [Planctomycetota bacterium]